MFGLRHGFKVGTCTRYLDGYIGDDESKRDFLKDSMYLWEQNICMISETAGKYTKESYAAVVLAIQSEWIFIHTRLRERRK